MLSCPLTQLKGLDNTSYESEIAEALHCFDLYRLDPGSPTDASSATNNFIQEI